MFNIRSIYLEWNSNLALRRNVINTSHFENLRRICRKKNGMRRIYFQSVHSVYRTGNTSGIAEAANCSQKGRRCRLTCSLNGAFRKERFS